MRLLALLVIAASLAVLLRTLRKRAEPGKVDEMAQPFLDSDWAQQGRNSATYLYNATTGVIVSQN